jgi:hypothetical protein
MTMTAPCAIVAGIHPYHTYIITHTHTQTHTHTHRLVEWVGEEPRTAGGRAWKKVCDATEIEFVKRDIWCDVLW